MFALTIEQFYENNNTFFCIERLCRELEEIYIILSYKVSLFDT